MGPPFVLCHPFGEEKLWTHRVFVSFARQLASDGYPVLRFDYMGNGDSEGDFSQSSLATACDDVRAAIAEVRRRTGAQTVNLLGLRFGALVASLVAEDATDVDRLILWAPIVDGGRYMQELLRINLTTQMATAQGDYAGPRGHGRRDAAGRHGQRRWLRDGVSALFRGLRGQAGRPTGSNSRARCLIVQVDRQPEPRRCRVAAACGRVSQATLVAAQEEPFWKEITRFYDEAPEPICGDVGVDALSALALSRFLRAERGERHRARDC